MMNIRVKHILIALACGFNIVLSVYGAMVLLESPYTGIRMSDCGDDLCVENIDVNSPAYGKVEPGDRFIGVENVNLQSFVFSPDPDYIATIQDQRIFWESQRLLNTLIHKRRPVLLQFSRNGAPVACSITPASFPLSRAVGRSLPQYFVGWTFLVVACLVLRKQINEVTAANFIIGAFACAAFCTLAPYCVRDLAFPSGPFKVLTTVNYIASQTFCYALFHMLLVFPRRKAVLQRYPWIAGIPYLFLAVVAYAHFAGLFENTHVTTYLSMNLCLIASFSAFVYDFLREKRPVYRKQIQWIVFGSLAGIISWLALTSLPIVLGMPYLSQEISILPTVIYPLSFAFAVTKYRLMDIDSILDTAVVYGFTIIILAGVEMVFLSVASPYLLGTGRGVPAFSVVAVLLIVFIYVPIRNAVKNMVERLFKRGKYDAKKELQRFAVSLGLCDERPVLEKFILFLNNLLKPSGIAVLKMADETASLLYAGNDHSRREVTMLMPQAAAIWREVRAKGTCAFGYEISEKIGTNDLLLNYDIENALFLPFITGSDTEAGGYFAMLLKKKNETAYSAKDVTLLNVLSVSIASIIEAGELRKERAEIENRYRMEKDAVMKELHDGLGNILSSVTVTSQAAEKMLSADASKARELVGRIGEFSAEAMDFMRTGLTVLDNPEGSVGSLMELIRERFVSTMDAAGMELSITCTDDAKKIRPGAHVIMNVVRILQEALTNIMKHSGAKRVWVEVAHRGQKLTVAVVDDGKGFDCVEKKRGYGLANMQQRVDGMAGAMELTSSAEKGTKIAVLIPNVGCGWKGMDTNAACDR